MKYSPYKKALAVVLAFVLVFGMAMPGFAAYGEGNGAETDTEQTATLSDLPIMETQTTSPAALQGYVPIIPTIDHFWTGNGNEIAVLDGQTVTLQDGAFGQLTIPVGATVNIVSTGLVNIGISRISIVIPLTARVTWNAEVSGAFGSSASVAVLGGGDFEMTGGSISGTGIALSVGSGSTATINNGILETTATGFGAIEVLNGSNLIIESGIVRGNAVAIVVRDGSVTVNSGVIEANSSAISLYAGQSATINSGIINGQISGFGNATITGGNFTVSTFEQLRDQIALGGTQTITITANITHTNSIGFPTGSNITLLAGNPGITLSRNNAEGVPTHFNLHTGETLTLGDGSSGVADDITLTRAGGNTGNFGGVLVAGGTFIMRGGTISNNQWFNGGGVEARDGGTFRMYGGIISGNTGIFVGGGVNIFGAGSSFTMNGGTITGNTSPIGANVNVEGSGGTFTFNSGTIVGGTPTIDSANSTSTAFGTADTFTVTATSTVGAPITFALSGQPTGVSINSTTGVISITDIVVGGTHPFSITATNEVGTSTVQNFTLTVTGGIALTTHSVTINASHATTSGAGNYAVGATVTINAGTRTGFNFGGWTVNSGGVSLTNANNATTTFTMPVNDVTVTANWTQISTGGNSGWTPTNARIPQISQQPQSTTADISGNVTLSVTAASPDNGTLSYQWQSAAGASGGSFTNIPNATERTFSPNTDNAGVNRYRVVVTNTNNAVDGSRTASINSDAATLTVTTVVTTLDPTPDQTTPSVRVELSPALTAELQERLGERFNDLEISVTYDIAQTTPQGAAMSDIHAYYDVNVVFSVKSWSAAVVTDADGVDTIFPMPNAVITDLENHYYLIVDMSNFYLGNLNHHRIVALNTTSAAYRQDGYIGSVLGGNIVFNPAVFTLQTNQTGEFTIAYVRNLIRLDLNLNSPTITDLAGNAPIQTMDVLPTTQNGRTLIPIRFISNALGADIGWSNATDDRPLTVDLTLDGQTLSFGIGEITPELAALGMDVPAQLMGNRTMVPLRFISEFFGAVVNWDSETRGIEIISMGAAKEDEEETPN